MASTENLALSNVGRALASGYEEDGLQRVPSRRSRPYEVQNEHVSLPKADGGKDAWFFLAGCFCIEALTWGECTKFCICYLLQRSGYDYWPNVDTYRVDLVDGFCRGQVVQSYILAALTKTT